MVGPILEEISDEMSDQVIIAKLDIEKDGNTGTKYSIRVYPQCFYFQMAKLNLRKLERRQKVISSLGLKKIFNLDLILLQLDKEIQLS